MKFRTLYVAIVFGVLAVFLSYHPSFTEARNAPVIQAPQPTDANTAFSRGRALLKQGRADQALGYLDSALKQFTAANNGRGIAATEDALGDLYMIQGQYKVALPHYQKAYEAFAAARGKDETNQAAGNALASQAGGTLGAAAATAGSLADNGFNANLMLAKIGDTNYRLGRMSEASAAYAMMIVKQPESAKKSGGGGPFGGLPSIMGGGKPSIPAPTSVSAGLMEIKKQLDEYRATIVYMTHELGTGRIAFASNDLEGARKHFQAAMEAGTGALPGVTNLGQTRRFRAAARTSLGDVALRQARYKDAIKLFNDAANGALKDKRLDLIWPAKRGLGRSLWMQAAQEKDSAKAVKGREDSLAAYREALKTVETIREGSLRADESRTTFLATTKDVYDEASSTLAEMALLSSPAPGPLSGKGLEYAAESFKVTEQGRARSLLDMLGEVNAQITEGVPADLLKRKQDNLDRQQAIAEQLTGISLGEQKEKPAKLEEDLDKLQTEFDDIENQIRTASPRYAALTAPQPLALADVQQKVLDENTALLEYSLGADTSYLFAVTPSSVSLFKLPRRSEVAGLATEFRARLIPAKLQRRIVGIDVAADQQRGLGLVQGPTEDLGAFVAASSALYKAVVEPAVSVVGDKRLLIVADGTLNYVPFEALVKTTEGADYASLNYLIKSNEVVYAPSASVIAAIRQQGNRSTSKNLLVVADPVFSSNDPRLKGNTAVQGSGEARGLALGLESAISDVSGAQPQPSGFQLARLAGTRAEADAIARIARTGGSQSDLWTDLNANEENVRTRDVTNYRVVHIATHGLLDAERPQFTGVVLSLVGNKTGDGFLRTDEIFNLKLGSPLVMLSACETGLGKEKRGEGVIGLTRAFMYAGAPTVGVSLWSVADKSTADLMTDFYKRLLSPTTPVSPTGAMRDAQRAMIAGKKYSAPFYWAPFVLVGEWK